MKNIISLEENDLHTREVLYIAPEKWWLEDYVPFGKVTFEGNVKLQACKCTYNYQLLKVQSFCLSGWGWSSMRFVMKVVN